RKLVSPTARMLAASPDTIWSALCRTATMAITAAINAPPIMLPPIASRALPLSTITMTAPNATASNMPSRPTAKTPARSEMIAPMAPNTSGVAIRIAEARKSGVKKASMRSSLHAAPRVGRDDQGEQHGDALDHGHQRGGHADLALHRQRTRLEEA